MCVCVCVCGCVCGCAIDTPRVPFATCRSAQQLEFHEAFKKAAARIIYRDDWQTEKPKIMAKYKWTKVNGEVLISTPRRFGKTFS